MITKDLLEKCANVAEILTALVAAVFYIGLRWRRWSQMRTLENYLRGDKANAKPPFTGKRTVVHLMAQLRLTEDEVYQASFRSDHIRCLTAVDYATHRATEVLFEYVENPG